jgi:uncharacterized protein
VQGPVTHSIVLSRLSICFVTSGGEDRNLLTLLERVEVPVYLGCDWQNVALHLALTFTGYERPANSKHLQVARMGWHGLAWPWESLHIDVLAWFDH